MKTKETIGELLRRLREEKGWTQDAFAKLSGIPIRTVQKYESDEREPGLRNAGILASAIGIDVNDLLATREATGKPKRPRGRPRKS